MSNKHFIGKQMGDIARSAPLSPYTGVAIIVNESADPDVVNEYTAGDNSGRVLEISNPWGNQRMADSILARIRGYQYKPFTADDAFVPDWAELGDGVNIGPMYGLLAKQDIAFDGLGTSDIASPGEDETDNEFGDYISHAERQMARQFNGITTEFTVGLDRITLGVTKASDNIGSNINVTLRNITSTVTNGIDRTESNINQTSRDITKTVSDGISGTQSIIRQTASSISARINNEVNGTSHSITMTACGIRACIEDTLNDKSFQISTTASGIQGEIAASEDRIKNSFSATAEGFRATISNDISDLRNDISINASGIKTRINDAQEGLTATIQACAGCIVSELNNTTEGLKSAISQSAGTIRTRVANAESCTTSTITQEASIIRACIVSEANDTRNLIEATADKLKLQLNSTSDGMSTVFEAVAGCVQAILDDKIKNISTSITATAAGISVTAKGLSDAENDISGLQKKINRTLAFNATSGLVIYASNNAQVTINETAISFLPDTNGSSIKGLIAAAKRTADTAQSTASTAQSTASSAQGSASSALTTAQAADDKAAAAATTADLAIKAIPDYIQSTQINMYYIASPAIVGTHLAVRGGALYMQDIYGSNYGYLGRMSGDEAYGYPNAIGMVTTSTSYVIATQAGGVRMQGGSLGSIYVSNDIPAASGYDSKGQYKQVNLLDAQTGSSVATFG